MSGGVASNQYVRARLNQVVQNNDLELVCPPPSLCTDNGECIFYLDGHFSGRSEKLERCFVSAMYAI